MTPPAAPLTSTMTVVMSTEPDPQVCSRVLGLFAQRNLVPSWFSAWKETDEVMQIVLRISCPTGLDWRYLRHRLEAIPSALSVEASVEDG